MCLFGHDRKTTKWVNQSSRGDTSQSSGSRFSDFFHGTPLVTLVGTRQRERTPRNEAPAFLKEDPKEGGSVSTNRLKQRCA